MSRSFDRMRGKIVKTFSTLKIPREFLHMKRRRLSHNIPNENFIIKVASRGSILDHLRPSDRREVK